MGTIYRTGCLCLESRPEPRPAEFPTRPEYHQAHDEWAEEWTGESLFHESGCPLSTHYAPILFGLWD